MKLEYFNPGGSIKDRIAFYMIKKALDEKKIDKNSIIIEATAGNTGVGVALCAKILGLKAILVVPYRYSIEKQLLIKALGAEVINTENEKGMAGAIEKTYELKEKYKNSYLLGQYENIDNPMAHYYSTAKEIDQDLNSNVDISVIGAGSIGTVTGITKYFKEKNPNFYSVLVEPEGSVLCGAIKGPHKVEGIGISDAGEIKFYEPHIFDEIYVSNDKNSHDSLLELSSKYGILGGGSSGSNFYAARKIREKIINKEINSDYLIKKYEKGEKINIITLAPDSSERYISKNIYHSFDEWKV
jgi:cysteine synthase